MPRIYGLYGRIGTLICLLSLLTSSRPALGNLTGWDHSWVDSSGARIADRRLDPLFPSCQFLGDTATEYASPSPQSPRPYQDRHQRPRFSGLPLVQIAIHSNAEATNDSSLGRRPADDLAMPTVNPAADQESHVSASIHVLVGDPIGIPAESDPYWQYYADCDYWDIRFATPPADSYSAAPLDRCTDPQGLSVQELAQITQQTSDYLASFLGDSARQLALGLSSRSQQVSGAIERIQFRWIETWPSTWRLDRRPPSASLSVLAMRLALHQIAQPAFLDSPLSWGQIRIRQGVVMVRERFHQSGLKQWAVRIGRETEAERLRQEQLRIELTRQAARKVNWYAYQLHRMAVAIERQAAIEADQVSRQASESRLK